MHFFLRLPTKPVDKIGAEKSLCAKFWNVGLEEGAASSIWTVGAILDG